MHALGVAHSHLLRDRAAHGRTDHMGLLYAEDVQQADRICGHVGQCVRHAAWVNHLTRQTARYQVTHVGNTRLRQPGGLPDVAVVKAYDVVAALRQLGAEGLVPGNHLCAQAHHQQQRRLRSVAKAVVSQTQVMHLCEPRHGNVAVHRLPPDISFSSALKPASRLRGVPTPSGSS